MTTVYFVRHAQPDFSWAENKTRPLTEEGKKDAVKVREFFKDKKIDSFYCSPYERSSDTIKPTAEYFKKKIIYDERLRERVSGKNGNIREMFEKRWNDHSYHEPDGESLAEVQESNIEALNKILSDNKGKSVVVGTHGTALSTILNYFNPEFGYLDFMRIIDWMPYIIELSFDGDSFDYMKEHLYIEKKFN